MRCQSGRIAASGSRAKMLPRIRTKTQLPTRSSTACRRMSLSHCSGPWYASPSHSIASRRPSGALSTKSIRYAADPELRHRPVTRGRPAAAAPSRSKSLSHRSARSSRRRGRPATILRVRQQQRPGVVGQQRRRPHRVEDPELVPGPGRGHVDPAVVLPLGERGRPGRRCPTTTMDTSTTSRSSPWNVYASPTRSRRASISSSPIASRSRGEQVRRPARWC